MTSFTTIAAQPGIWALAYGRPRDGAVREDGSVEGEWHAAVPVVAWRVPVDIPDTGFRQVVGLEAVAANGVVYAANDSYVWFEVAGSFREAYRLLGQHVDDLHRKNRADAPGTATGRVVA